MSTVYRVIVEKFIYRPDRTFSFYGKLGTPEINMQQKLAEYSCTIDDVIKFDKQSSLRNCNRYQDRVVLKL